MPPLLGIYDFTAGLPSPPPTGVSAYTAGLLCRRCWTSTSSPTGLPSSPPTGVSACTAGLLCRRCWASTTSPPACLRRRRLVSPPARLAYYAAAVGHLRLHRRLAFVAADWCLRLHGWPIMPPLLGIRRPAFVAADWCLRLHGWPIMPLLLGIYDFTADWYLRLHGWPIMPPLLGIHIFTDRPAFAAANWCLRLHGWPIMPPLLGIHVFTDRLAFVAADWCLRLHGWPIMPPLLGIYDFTAGLPSPPPTGVSAYTAGLLCRRCSASTSSPTGLPSSPPTGVSACTAGLLYAAVVGRSSTGVLAYTVGWIQIQICIKGIHGFKLISYAPGMDQSEHHRPAASSAADWCFRLHGWPLCRRCWASTSSPTGRLVRCRLVFLPALLAYYAAVVGRVHLHRLAASSAADWCFRLHGWPLMLPLLGVYIFTDRPPSPTGRLVRRRLVFPPARLAYYAAVVGRLHLHRPAVSSAADWCFRLHDWPIMPPLLGVYVFTDRLAFAAADWCLRLHDWPIMPPLLGVSVFNDRPPRVTPTSAIVFTAGHVAATANRRHHLQRKLSISTADWFLHFHGCMNLPLPLLMDIIVFRRRLVMPPPTGAFIFTIARLHYRAELSTNQLSFDELDNIIYFPPIAIDWITDIVIFINILSSLFNIAHSTAIDGQLRHYI
uniref:cysteine dioxygenase n=1 Tax=Oryza sativa subsp. japonica TaxID=39947 RepID=Q6Z3L6_ORYSJ|nr:HGWP repeat containing protein-like [Oryza sativa Japonica Group]